MGDLSIMTMSKRSKAPKKEYDRPGQKKDPPDKLDSLRLFYESLYREKGLRSRMAMKWMLEHGLLPAELARKLDAGIWEESELRDVCKFSFKTVKFKVTVSTFSLKKVVFDFKPRKAIKTKFSFKPKVIPK